MSNVFHSIRFFAGPNDDMLMEALLDGRWIADISWQSGDTFEEVMCINIRLVKVIFFNEKYVVSCFISMGVDEIRSTRSENKSNAG